MVITELTSRPSNMWLLALIATLTVGCGLIGGGDRTEATGQPAPAVGPVVAIGETGEDGSDTGEGDPSEENALGEITDPSETEDPDATTPDTTPQTEVRRLRTSVQTSIEQQDWQIADEQATAALERTDLTPDFRMELEAYRDLARAAATGDEPAAGDAIERLQRLEPEFVDDLVIHRVLPEAILPRSEFDGTAIAAPADNTGGTTKTDGPDNSDGAGDAVKGSAVTVAAEVDDVAKALAVGDWQLADRLAEKVLADRTLTVEDTARVRLYEQLAEAHAKADAADIARATESLAAIDPDLARRLEPPAPTVDGDLVTRSDR